MTPSAEEIRDWLVLRVSALADIKPADVDVRARLTRYGLDSVAVVALAGELEQWLNYRFRANPMDDHPTVEALARFLAEEITKEGRTS